MLAHHGSGRGMNGYERVYYRVAKTIYEFCWSGTDQTEDGSRTKLSSNNGEYAVINCTGALILRSGLLSM
jgi:hypothetical protein